MTRLNAIVIALFALYLAGAVASFWSGPDVSYIIAWMLLAGMVVLVATVRRAKL